jgi:hypothetical protein
MAAKAATAVLAVAYLQGMAVGVQWIGRRPEPLGR